jgi:release factor glutamine methyltransferase
LNRHQTIEQFSEKYSLPLKTVEKIVAFVYEISLEKLFFLDTLDDARMDRLESSIQKVAFWYPLDYLIQTTNFYWLDFYVDSNVLIPRDDTELLVDKAVEYIRWIPTNIYFFDIWTGSGCIPVALFSQVWEKIDECFLFEISAPALEVAKINVWKLTPSSKFQFYAEDFHNLPWILPRLNLDFTKHIVMTANLPYIKVHDIYLWKEVLDHEPTVALFWGTWTGFELYDDFFEILFSLQDKYQFQVTVFAEIWYDQSEVAKEFLTRKNLNFEFFRDTGLHDRVIKISL